ncbi:hypothetical protein EM6_3131 [Asticcacaulis excentricus]|uniref:Uncharacterized protein n=1 Tax=Asticcacaulis excentricus TaxID=78587 RepID=A0A3G9G579_9CAUL|nr:hypothetical protein EM6_3131 [Asticcacaulis excentricus]
MVSSMAAIFFAALRMDGDAFLRLISLCTALAELKLNETAQVSVRWSH